LTIDRIDILETNLPFNISSIDYKTYDWGGREILLTSIRDTSIVHLRVISNKDAIYTKMVVSKDSVEVQHKCNINSKTRKSFLFIGPSTWIKIWLNIPNSPNFNYSEY